MTYGIPPSVDPTAVDPKIVTRNMAIRPPGPLVTLGEFVAARVAEDGDEGGWCGCVGHLRLRAARWAGHPDYDPSWSPEVAHG